MALNIKNKAVESLVAEITQITGETKVEAIRKALEERKNHLESERQRPKRERVLAFLEERVWSKISEDLIGKTVSKSEIEEILGYGSKGV
jgi:antitoxin VapB